MLSLLLLYMSIVHPYKVWTLNEVIFFYSSHPKCLTRMSLFFRVFRLSLTDKGNTEPPYV